ncbi:hypothetical protein [Desulfopila aestuarii]|nr:hypothetical protein [Desulfopila aestuarii]
MSSVVSKAMTAIDQRQPFSSLSDVQSLMHSLQRLMKIGLYYPDGHSVLTKATGNFQRDLARVARDNSSVHLSLRNDQLFLENIEIPRTSAFTNELVSILSTLGIDELEIDREIEASEITSFLQKMLQYQAQVQSSRFFQQIDFHDLPYSIRITQKEFLTTQAATVSGKSSSDERAQPSLEQFMERLQKKGVAGQQLARCRAVMESLAAKDVADIAPQADIPHVDWQDIEMMLIRITGEEQVGPGTGSTSSADSLNSLASILQALEQHTSVKRSKEAINLLVSMVKNQPAGQEEGLKKISPDRKAGEKAFPVVPLVKLDEFVRLNHPGKIQLSKLFAPDRREELGILLLQLERGLPLDIEARIFQSMRNILTSKLDQSEWEVLVQGMKCILRRVEQTRFASILKIVLPPLRRSQPASSIVLLNQIIDDCSPQDLRKVWPHAVNELIRLGSRRAPADFHYLCYRVSSLPMEAQKSSLPLLQELDSFQENTVAPDVCSNLQPDSYQLFSLLLNTSLQSQLVSRIIQDFTLHPPGETIETVVPFFDKKNPLHVQFLRTYLQQSKPHAPVSVDAARLAGEIIAESLLALPRENRSESFVLKAISIIGELHAEAGKPTLETIIESKRWLLIPEWPVMCRKKAADSLRALRRSKTIRKSVS